MSNRPAASSGSLSVSAIDHVSYTVSDIVQAIDFFVQVLGARILYRRESGTLAADIAVSFDVAPNASFRLAKLEIAGTALELFEYRDTGRSDAPTASSTCGGGHFALLVDDIDSAVERVGAVPGVRLLGEVSVLPDDHPLAGRRWIYFLTPFGLQIELVSRVA